MENASKALIIAGAILLAILLISLGIYIFSQAQSVVNDSGFSKAEIQTFNNQFSKYEGIQTGASVKSLIQEVNTSNTTDANAQNGRQISLVAQAASGKTFTLTQTSTYNAAGTTANTYQTNIPSAGKYDVKITARDSSGYISAITITKQ